MDITRMAQMTLFSVRVETNFDEYNKISEYTEQKKEMEAWFGGNIDPFFTKSFTEIDGVKENSFFKMYHYETISDGVSFYVGVLSLKEYLEDVLKEVSQNKNVKKTSFCIYDPESVKEPEEKISEELMALEG